jgi:hypothetical protein
MLICDVERKEGGYLPWADTLTKTATIYRAVDNIFILLGLGGKKQRKENESELRIKEKQME